MKKKRPPSPAKRLVNASTSPSALAATRTVTAFQGPLPPPELMEKYNQMVPGAAERIIVLFESQVQHRQSLEKAVIQSDVRDSRLGLYLGFFVSVVAIIGGVICVLSGYTTTGGIIAAIPVPVLAGVFVYGSSNRRLEREARRKE
ncbi:MAG TPA: DUF2335 domain-containing protein [Syntrophales bacterium]|nr:DUF2335 domain-containing protein [Syntrophales bacterium]